MSAPLQIPITSAANLVIRTSTSVPLIDAVRHNTPVSETDWEAGNSFFVGLSAAGSDTAPDSDPDADTGTDSLPLSVAIPAGEGRTLKFSAQASKGVSLKRDFSGALAALPLAQEITKGLADPHLSEKHHFMMLHWNYGLAAALEGTLPLGAGKSAVYGVEAGRERLFAVIHAVAAEKGTRDAVGALLRNWKMPRSVQDAADLSPGTWLITEIDSSVTAKLGCQLGYDFSWVHEFGKDAEGLKGDIGLKLESAIRATVGFDFSGKFALVVARESADPSHQKLRVRLFKLRKKGWDFALSATAKAETSGQLEEADLEPLLRSVFGIEPKQLLGDLKSVRKWVGKNSDLAQYFGEVSADAVYRFLEEVTGINAEESIEEASARLSAFFEKWDELSQETAARLWKVVEDGLPLDDIRALLNIITETDEAAVRSLLAEKLGKPDFFDTPAGKILLTLVPQEDLFKALTDANGIRQLRANAGRLLALIDGDVSERMLKALSKAVDARWNLSRIRNTISQHDFDSLDEWLKGRLAEFYGKKLDKLGLPDLKKLQEFMQAMEDRKAEITGLLQEAVSHQYEASLNYAYSKSRSNEALIDLTLDFAQAHEQEARELLRMVMDGKFDRVMTETFASVTLHEAVLTHGIKRTVSVDFTLPFVKRNIDELTTSVASGKALDTEDGRIIMYSLGTESAIIRKYRSAGLLSVWGYFESSKNRVRRHSTAGIEFSYILRQAHQKRSTTEMKLALTPILKEYFPGVSPLWIDDVDKAIDVLEENETGNLGTVLQSLRIHVPGAQGARWFNAPENERDYQAMADLLMKTMRETFFSYYLNRLSESTHKKNTADALLLYSSIPQDFFPGRRGKKLHWYSGGRYRSGLGVHDFDRKSVRAAMMPRLLALSNRMGTRTDLEDRFGNYTPVWESTTRVLNDVFNSPTAEEFFNNLLWVEQRITERAAKAGRELNEAVRKSASKPQKAVKAFANFGERLADAFNGKLLREVFGDDELSAMGAILFAEAPKAFPELPVSGSAADTAPGILIPAENTAQPQAISALLSLHFMKPDAQTNHNDFLKTGRFDRTETVLSTQLVSLPDE